MILFSYLTDVVPGDITSDWKYFVLKNVTIFHRLLSLQSCASEVWYPSDSFQPTPPHPSFYWEIIAMQHSISSRHTEWWFDLYIWWNDHHHRFSYFIVYRNQYTKRKGRKKKNLSSWRTLRIDSLDNFLITPQGSLPAVMPNVIPSTQSPYSWESVPWTIFLQFLLSSSSSPGHCKSDLFSLLRVFLFCCLFVYRFHE